MELSIEVLKIGDIEQSKHQIKPKSDIVVMLELMETVGIYQYKQFFSPLCFYCTVNREVVGFRNALKKLLVFGSK